MEQGSNHDGQSNKNRAGKNQRAFGGVLVDLEVEFTNQVCHGVDPAFWMEAAVFENTLFALPPITFTVPTTSTRMTASITAYSATS